MPVDSLPIVDLRAPEPRAIRDACERHGFFYVGGHGVDSHGARAWRGWFPLGGELTSGAPDR